MRALNFDTFPLPVLKYNNPKLDYHYANFSVRPSNYLICVRFMFFYMNANTLQIPISPFPLVLESSFEAIVE